MASNRPTPHGPSTYGLGGPADFSGAVGFGAPVGPAGPSGAGAPVQPSQVPPIAGGLREGQPPQEPFSRDLSHGQASPAPQTSPPRHRSAQGVLPGDAPSPGLEGEGEVRGEGDGTGDAWLPADESSDDDGPLRALRGKHRVARRAAAVSARRHGTGRRCDRGGRRERGGRGPGSAAGADIDARPGGRPTATARARRPARRSPPPPAPPSPPPGPAPPRRGRPGRPARGRGRGAAQPHPPAGRRPAGRRPAGRRPQDAAEPEAGTGAEHAAAPQADQGAPGSRGGGTGRHRRGAHGGQPPAAQGTAPRATAADAPATPAADHRAHPTRTFVAPVSSYTLAAGFGQADDRWAADHTGQDFTAPTGTLVKAVHDGTITQAGWAGGYGYRIVLTLDDGTQLWFCHLSSMVKTTGRVHTGDVIGRVGATGNATGPHLHLEVRPDAGAPTDPVSWLRDRGTTV
ncbi:M23 family metallopeptidase [Streptomyces noursei]|nr:M23 family metallopeptidase [Streptomyces noursei]